MRFKDRQDAGEQLAQRLEGYKGQTGVVLAIPRGGVVTAQPICRELGWPMDLVITRKVGHPQSSEYALCVVAEDGHRMGNEDELKRVDQEWLKEAIRAEMAEARRRRLTYVGDRARPEIEGKVVILVDDGVATGLTFLAAVKELKHRQPAKIVAALPVMPKEFEVELVKEVDEIVCLNTDEEYSGAVGAYYNDFPQVSDEEVKAILKQ